MAHYGGLDPRTKSDEEIVQWTKEYMSGYNWNIVDMGKATSDVLSKGDAVAKSFLNIMEMTDATDTSAGQVGRGVKALVTDP